jgi:phosphoribosylcarboxyaminoimidazole (NCAIR) mutase
MPKGIPVATVAIGGGENAGLLAAQILGGRYPEIAERVKSYREAQTESVLNSAEAKGTSLSNLGADGVSLPS